MHVAWFLRFNQYQVVHDSVCSMLGWGDWWMKMSKSFIYWSYYGATQAVLRPAHCSDPTFPRHWQPPIHLVVLWKLTWTRTTMFDDQASVDGSGCCIHIDGWTDSGLILLYISTILKIHARKMKINAMIKCLDRRDP